ncbi:MAG: signal peptidase I [bacterium]|nr:signal peptidase I [bacterium]
MFVQFARLLKPIAILLFFVLITIGFLFFGRSENRVLEEFEVRNNSMSGLLEPGEKIEVDFNYYKNNEIERGDVVLFSYAGNENYLVKTVYGIPGDIVDLENAGGPARNASASVAGGQFRLLINGRAAVNSEDNEFVFSAQKANLLSLYIADYKGRIPSDAYLILGNLEGGSVDSSKFGFVAKENIVGKVIR